MRRRTDRAGYRSAKLLPCLCVESAGTLTSRSRAGIIQPPNYSTQSESCLDQHDRFGPLGRGRNSLES